MSALSRRDFSLALGSSLLGGLACGGSGTGGRAVSFSMALRSAPAPGEALPGHFTTDTGWRVALSSAWMLLGPFYLFEQASPLAGGSHQRGWRRLGELLLPSAHAHESFFAGGRVLGEWDREVVFNLLSGEARVLGLVPGIAGTARSLSVLLQPGGVVKGDEAASLRGHSVWLEGVASHEGAELLFQVGLDFPPPLESQRVEFVPVEAPLDEGGTFVVEALPHAWFQGVRFERMEAPVSGEAVALSPESQPYRALHVNARRYSAFSGQWLG